MPTSNPTPAAAQLSFLPWVRQGAAAAINTVDTLGPQRGVVDLAAALTVNGAASTPLAVRLRGPADVVGIDPNQVIRTDPRPGTNDFEPNCFASIEFDRADFPWLFTPARADANAKLRPWLCLVVVRKQAGVSVGSSVDAPLPVLQIATPAKPADELPDLHDAWAWAHSQAAAADSSAAEVGKALNGAPHLQLSRLVCPHLLKPNTDYIACVVPSFELGRKAGLGQPIREADMTAANALAAAWALAPAPAQVQLPVYYQWEFRTGEQGDFESLVKRLKPALPEGLGTRSVDVAQPGFELPHGFPPELKLDLEGALAPMTAGDTLPVRPWDDTHAPAFQKALAAIVDEPDRRQASNPKADPLLAPPLYGRWHAGRGTVAPAGPTWLDELNLDPRWRTAAAHGTRVVQEHQEALMASAWEQAAQLQQANQRLRQMQLSMSVGESLHARHFMPLSDEMMMRVAAPVFPRIRRAGTATLLATQQGSALPVPATRSAMRRIGRLRGPLTRRVAAQDFERTADTSWVAQLNLGLGFPPAPPRAGPDFCTLPSLNGLGLAQQSNFGAFRVVAEHMPLPAPGAPQPLPAAADMPGFFRAAAIEHLARVFPPRTIAAFRFPDAFQAFRTELLEQTHPKRALVALAQAIVSTGDSALPPNAPGVAPLGIETVMAAPTFTQPMYEALRDLSPELLLPGLDKVTPDSVLGLKTNRPFVESYLVGLNHEMGRELLWRGYPTDQRGTCFAHFWGRGVPNAAPADIQALHTWGARPLGDSATAPAGEQFVMLMRSGLLRRYPNAVILLVPAVQVDRAVQPAGVAPSDDTALEVPPLFSGSLPPDVSFFGFPVSSAAANGSDGGLGWYVVIQEHPTEPRFGLDVGVSAGGASHLPIGTQAPAGVPLNGLDWGRNAAHMAGITRRLPARIAIHAARLLHPN